MDKFFWKLLTFLFLTTLPIQFAIADEPSAIIEDFQGTALGIEAMQIVHPSAVLALNKDDVLVLGYFTSCVRETIISGTVTVGSEESNVIGGTKKTDDVDCDGGSMVGPNASRKEAAVAVFRKDSSKQTLPKPDWTLFGISPLFKLSKPAKKITIERIDRDDKLVEIHPKTNTIDALNYGIRLVPSGLYSINIDGKSFYLKVSPLAEIEAPILSRIVMFDSKISKPN